MSRWISCLAGTIHFAPPVPSASFTSGFSKHSCFIRSEGSVFSTSLRWPAESLGVGQNCFCSAQRPLVLPDTKLASEACVLLVTMSKNSLVIVNLPFKIRNWLSWELSYLLKYLTCVSMARSFPSFFFLLSIMGLGRSLMRWCNWKVVVCERFDSVAQGLHACPVLVSNHGNCVRQMTLYP